MALPAARAKLLHIPTPDAVIDRLRAVMTLPRDSVVFDPCCGSGQALARLAPDAKRFGIELDPGRAREASERFERVIACSFFDSIVSNDTFGFCLLNPPYDDSIGGRLEKLFLERTTRLIADGGLLALIVQEKTIPSLAKHLARYYNVLAHWRFPASEYGAFEQTVLIAERHTCWGETGEWVTPSEWPDEAPSFHPRTMGDLPTRFVSNQFSPADLEALANQSTLPRFPEEPPELGCGSPPLPLKQGHVSQALAAGLVDGVFIDTRGMPHVARGTIVRQQKSDVDWNERTTVRTVTDAFAVKIRIITQAGELINLAGGEEVRDDNADGKKKGAAHA